MKKFTDYSGYKLQELLEDDIFISLVNSRRTDPVLAGEWEKFLLTHAGEARVFREAAGIIDISGGASSPVNAKEKADTWEKIVSGLEKAAKPVPFSPKPAFPSWWRIAALFLLFVSAGAAVIWYRNDRVLPAGTSGMETVTRPARQVKLPDHSIVVLGTNSRLTYKKNWAKDKVREVWLSGEAHFEVNHLNKGRLPVQSGERFIVHVGNKMQVEVLGTVFNIKNAFGKTAVELESGSVKIALNGNLRNYIWLKPGEKVELDTLTHSVVKSLVAPQTDQSAEEQLVELNNTSVVDIIRLIETRFHKKVIVRDSSVLPRKIDGLLPMNKENEVLFIISSILNVPIDNTDPGIIIIGVK